LLRLAKRAGTESDPKAILEALIDEAKRMTGCPRAFVGRWDEANQVLVDLLRTEPGADGVKTVTRLGEGIAGLAAAQRTWLIVNDYAAFDGAGPEAVRAGIRAAVAAPFMHEGRLLGVLVCAADDPAQQFTEDDAEMLVMLGSVAASTLVEIERKHIEDHLRLLTERFDNLLETTSDAIFVVDRDLRLRAWNRGAEQLFGWTRDEVLGNVLPTIPPDRMIEALRLRRLVMQQGQTVSSFEAESQTRDGRRVASLMSISPVRNEDGVVVGAVSIAKDLTALKAVEQQKRLLSRLEERESIAMDLHDNTIQALYGAVLLLSAVERQTNADVEYLRSAAREARQQLSAAIDELRMRLRDMRSQATSQPGLAAGLMRLVDQVRTNVRLGVDLDIEAGIEYGIGADEVEQLLALASEAIFNAVRHARAGSLAVRLAREGTAVALTIRDDGVGFDTTLLGESRGSGLANMSRRARKLNGHVSILSQLGGGTEVRVEVPFAASGYDHD
jgi:PAS domain S-box-containing protein